MRLKPNPPLPTNDHNANRIFHFIRVMNLQVTRGLLFGGMESKAEDIFLLDPEKHLWGWSEP